MIQYAGQFLPTPRPESLARLESLLPIGELRDFCRRTFPGRLPSLGQPWLERAWRPSLQTLFWPNSASKWAEGWFLVDAQQLGDANTVASIRQQAYAGGTLSALPFTISDGKATITTKLYLLGVLPLEQTGLAGTGLVAPGLSLLLLVDDRYRWWDLDATIAVTPGTTTWAQLFAAYGTALGVPISVPSIPAAYLTPPADFNTAHELLPVQIDAAARSVGMKLTRSLDGTLRLVSAALAQNYFAADLALCPVQAPGAPSLVRTMAGGLIDLTPDATGDLAGILPASVACVFPTVDANNVPTGGQTEQVETLSSLTGASLLPQYVGAPTNSSQPVLRSSCAAGPSNTAQITALAQQMAVDWYGWRQTTPHVCYSGVAPWLYMSGLEGRVEWSHRGPISTVVRRPPWNERDEGTLAQGSAGSFPPTPYSLTDELSDGSVIVSNVNTQVWDVAYFTLVQIGPGVASFSLKTGTTAHGLTVQNQNAPLNATTQVTLIKANNDLASNANNRIYWDGADLHWQGQRGTTDGVVFVGPQPDTWLSGGAGISVSVLSDATSKTIKYVITSTVTVPSLEVKNEDGTHDTLNVVLIKANNDQGTNAYKRMYWDGADLHWQGFRGTANGVTFTSAFPDLWINAGSNINVVVTSDGGSQTVKYTINLRATGAVIVSSVTTGVFSGVSTQIALATNEDDTDGFKSGDSFVIPAGLGGTYIIGGEVTYTDSTPFTAGSFQGSIQLNGMILCGYIVRDARSNAFSLPSGCFSRRKKLVAGDVLKLFAFQDTGVTHNASGFLWLERVGV